MRSPWRCSVGGLSAPELAPHGSVPSSVRTAAPFQQQSRGTHPAVTDNQIIGGTGSQIWTWRVFGTIDLIFFRTIVSLHSRSRCYPVYHRFQNAEFSRVIGQKPVQVNCSWSDCFYTTASYYYSEDRRWSASPDHHSDRLCESDQDGKLEQQKPAADASSRCVPLRRIRWV